MQGSVAGGESFASTNTSAVTIDPLPFLSSTGSVSVHRGQTGSVTIAGNYTSFLQGSTLASFGSGVAVGGAASGGYGPVTVTGPTSAIAQIAVDLTAALGARAVTVETGVQSESLANVLTITPANVSVPNVVGLTQVAASTAITGAGLVLGTVTTQSSTTVPSGNVISESPVAGTSVNVDSAVNLVVSSGPAKASVPNVVGDTQAAATTVITGAGLVLGTVATQSSTTVPSGNVISENPVAGTSVNVGSAVNIVVSTGPGQVAVPNVVGLTQAAATTAITGAGLVLGTVTTQSSTTVAAGNVISESPVAGTSVNAGSAVNLVVSTGLAKVSVPNVVGLTQATATTAITGAGLVLGTVTTQSSTTVAAGNVISESPVAGTSVNVGSAVNLVVSIGPAQVSVPNVVGLTQAAATTAITGAGLVLGTVTTQSSTTVAAGNVISESPAAGTSVNVGSPINLVVSTGPAKVAVPNVVGLTQAAATTAITGAGLVLGTVTTQSSTTVAAGNVISESPVAGTSVNVGSAVNLVVSTGPAQVAVPNVVGDTQAAAATTITTAGLVLGTVTTQSSNTVTAGNVISESPVAGTSVNAGSAVNLVVSSGKTGTGPASISVQLSAQVVAPDGSITVTPVALDSSGNPINDAGLSFTIQINAVGPTSGNAPVMTGNTITFPKLVKKLLNWNQTVDPNGIFTDTDPTDPNYGKQTGGVYQVTASLTNPPLSGVSSVVVLPAGTAPVTVQLYNYGSQLNAALSQLTTSYGNQDANGFAAAKTALQAVINNTNFSTDFLTINQTLAPPDGSLITEAQISAAGLLPGPDDNAWVTAIQNLDNAVLAATTAVNALSATSPTMAQVSAVQTATTNYKAALTTLTPLHPSSQILALNNDFFNQVTTQDIPTLLDSIKTLVSNAATPLSAKLLRSGPSSIILARATRRMHLSPQFLDIFFSMFGACVDLEGTATSNIIQLSISLANDIINLEIADLVNKNAPPGMSIDDIIASSSLTAVSPGYPNTEVDAFSFDPNPANDKVVLIGAVNSGLLASISTLSAPKGLGQSINLLYTLYSTARDIANAFNICAVVVPDQEIPGGGLFGDGSDAIIFNNGWPQVNQSALPAVGVIVVTNAKAGTFAAQTTLLVPGN